MDVCIVMYLRIPFQHTVSVHGLTECAVTLASEVVDLLCYGDRKY